MDSRHSCWGPDCLGVVDLCSGLFSSSYPLCRLCKDAPAMDVLAQILFGNTSELYNQLVIKDQMVEFIQGGQEDHRDPELFTVFTRIKDAKNIQIVRRAIDDAIEKAKTSSISAEKLEETKSHMKYQFAMGLDNPGSIARTICHYVQLTGDPESLNRIYAQYDKVTADDLKMVANKYFNNNSRTVIILTQEEKKQ